ncbi:60S ribosomal protein L17 [Anaeramoeba flamelloides]|uniref:60S ribosomal protein L17 n=1 Tax=Anaeramoeba flamelloides TaxID=1746091 RepID=A0AAV7ZV81_9EUKA|nr:60S ribosomal protein L17 [Anaeramoeba flamelloides]
MKYSKKLPKRSVRAKGTNLKVHFKNTCETGRAIKGRGLRNAQRYLQDVIEKRQCVPFRKFNQGTGRHGAAKNFKAIFARWPEKSARFLLDMLKNAESNAKEQELDLDKMIITHVQVNQAPKGRRRTFKAHGRITRYCSRPCHVQLFVSEQKWYNPKKKDRIKPLSQKKHQKKVNREKIKH